MFRVISKNSSLKSDNSRFDAREAKLNPRKQPTTEEREKGESNESKRSCRFGRAF
jgi:hypothetical protein